MALDCAVVASALGEVPVLVCDPGLCSALAAPLCPGADPAVSLGGRQWKVLLAEQSACVGYAVPAAIGAALARVRQGSRQSGEGGSSFSAPVTVLSDPQALLMTGPELTTAATERLPLMVVVPSYADMSTQNAPFLFGSKIDLRVFADCLGFRYIHISCTERDVGEAEAAMRLAVAHTAAPEVR